MYCMKLEMELSVVATVTSTDVSTNCGKMEQGNGECHEGLWIWLKVSSEA